MFPVPPHKCLFSFFCQTLYPSLSRWSENPELLCDSDLRSIFKEISHCSLFFDSVHTFVDIHLADKSVIKALQSLCKQSSVVTERQLVDFILGSFSIIEEQDKETLHHCLLTNLIGESALGDYDYDIFKRRNASLYSRSSLHIIKRNKTNFLSKQSPKV